MYRKCSLSIVSVCMASILLACSPEGAKRLEFGTPVPDARYTVELDRTYATEELRVKLDELAAIAGFDTRLGSTSSNNLPRDARPHVSDIWIPNPDTGQPAYQIDFSSPRGEATTNSFRIIYYQETSTEPFDEKDWIAFFRWQSDYIPSVFPNATVSVSRHPAEKTSRTELLRIMRETDLVVPVDHIPSAESE